MREIIHEAEASKSLDPGLLDTLFLEIEGHDLAVMSQDDSVRHFGLQLGVIDEIARSCFQIEAFELFAGGFL